MLRESDFQKRVQIILRRRILHCTKRMPPCIFETTLWHFLRGLFLFCGVRFFSFRFVLCWPWLKGVPPWTRVAALAPWFVFVLTKDVAFVSFAHSWQGLNRVRMERDCNTIGFPRSSTLHTELFRCEVLYEIIHIWTAVVDECEEWSSQFLAPNVWLHSSAGRASHRYRGGHGFESRWSPDFFQLLKLEN